MWLTRFPEPKSKVRESQLRIHREVQGLLPRKQGHIESVIYTREAAGGYEHTHRPRENTYPGNDQDYSKSPKNSSCTKPVYKD